MEVESEEELEEVAFVDSSASASDDQLEAILCQDGLPQDQISSIPSSRFSGEIASLRRDWEHISDIASEHQWPEDEVEDEEDCTPNYVSESESELSASVFQRDALSDESAMNEDVVEDDGGDGGRGIEHSYCQLEEKDDVICQLQEQLRSEQADKVRADEVNKSLQGEYERVRKRLAECEMHIDRLRLASSADGMATKNITLVYEFESMHLPAVTPSGEDVAGAKFSPTSGDVYNSSHSSTSAVELDSNPIPSRSRTPDGGAVPSPVRPATQQRYHHVATPSTVNDYARRRVRQGRESLNSLPMDVASPTNCSVQAVNVSNSEGRTQPMQGRKEEEEEQCTPVCVDQNRGATHEEESVHYSPQDSAVDDGAREGRAVESVVQSLSPPSSTSTSVLQLVSELSNFGSIAGFLAEEDGEGLPFSFSQDSLLHASQESVASDGQAQGRRKTLTQASTPVLSVSQLTDRQRSQTSRLRQPQASYRPSTAPGPTGWKLDLDELNDTCASEGSEYCSDVAWKPSRIPLRDHTYPLVDTPPNQQQEQGLPPMYAFVGEMDSGSVGSEGSWKPQSMGVREEADLVDQGNVDAWTISVEKSSSRSDGKMQTVQHRSSARTHQDQAEATPKGGPAPAHPIPTPSPLTERGTVTLGHTAEKTAEVDGLVALHKQLAAVQEELRHLRSLQHPQTVPALERGSTASIRSLPPKGSRQRTSAATLRRGSNSSSSPSRSEQVAMMAVSPPHSGQNSQHPHAMERQPDTSHQPATHTTQPEVYTANLGIHTAHFGHHTSHPGVHTANAGVQAAHPEVHTTHAGVQAAHPGVHTAHAEVHRTECGTNPFPSTAASRGTDPLHPMSDRVTSPAHPKTTSSGTDPRAVSRGTAHEPPVPFVSNTVTHITRGTDPEKPPTGLVREEVAGFASNERKHSHRQQTHGRLHHSNGQRKEPVLTEQGGSGADLSSSETVVPAKVRASYPLSFDTEPVNKEDLIKMYHVLHRAGLYGPWGQDEMKMSSDRAVQCTIDSFYSSPEHHSGRGKGHSHWGVGRTQSHGALLPSPRHKSTPRSERNREGKHRRRDRSRTFCIAPLHHRSPDRSKPMGPTDIDSCCSCSDAVPSSSATDSDEHPTFLAKLKLPRTKRDIKLKDLTLGDCRVVERGCEHRHGRQCSHHGNHKACSNHCSHPSCRRCTSNNGNQGSSWHHHHGHHSCRRPSSSLNKFPVEKEAPHRPSAVTVYGESVFVTPKRFHSSSRSGHRDMQERPCSAAAIRQAPPPPPCSAYSESKLREACRLAEKLKRDSRRMEWDLSLNVSRHYAHSFI